MGKHLNCNWSVIGDIKRIEYLNFCDLWEVSCFKSIADELTGLELTARKVLSVSPALIGPRGRNHCFRGESSLPVGIKSVLSLRQIRVSTEPPPKFPKDWP